MKTSYEQFIDDYALEFPSRLRRFKRLDVKKISVEDINKTITQIEKTYDEGVIDFFLDCLDGKIEISIVKLTNLALKNMNRYGTEMSMILNALDDFLGILSNYLPKDDDVFSEKDMIDAFK